MGRNKEPLISTTILNWNRADLLQRTLQSYIETINVPFELFVIDNASDDNSREIIERFCSSIPEAQGIFLEKNMGGEAIDFGFEKSRGKFLHISENDIEYLPGWSEKVISYFESFPSLGQLSLFGPVPQDEEVWVLKPSVLRHRNGLIVYEALGNIGSTCVIRRELWEKGVRVGNAPSSDTGFLFPGDFRLSEDVKKAGYMVAWSDHYMVRNLGHLATEFENRTEYYSQNYKSKPMLKEAGWHSRIAEWKRRSKPVRNSVLFLDEKISGEKTEPHEECPDPYLWSMIDGWTAEVEVLEFLYSLVRLIKPSYAIETGTWHGFAAEAIGRAMKDNDRGILITLEMDSESYQVASERIKRKCLDEYVQVINASSLLYDCRSPIDFLLLDSAIDVRSDEFNHFLPNLRPGAIVVFHDASSAHKIVREGARQLMTSGTLTGFFIPTPRGIAIFQYNGTKNTLRTDSTAQHKNIFKNFLNKIFKGLRGSEWVKFGDRVS